MVAIRPPLKGCDRVATKESIRRVTHWYVFLPPKRQMGSCCMSPGKITPSENQFPDLLKPFVKQFLAPCLEEEPEIRLGI